MQADEIVLIRCFDSARWGRTAFGARRFRRPDHPARCAAARKHRIAHPGVLPAGRVGTSPDGGRGTRNITWCGTGRGRRRATDRVGGLTVCCSTEPPAADLAQFRQQLVADQAHAGEGVADRHAAPMGAEDQKVGPGFLPARAQLLPAFLGAAEDKAVAQQGIERLAERIVCRQNLVLAPLA